MFVPNWIVVKHVIVILVLCYSKVMAKQEKQSGEDVLILGGNGFMGSWAVELFHMKGYNVHIANRDNWRWGLENYLKSLIVAQYYCDRKKLEKCDIPTNIFFKYIIDFSGYEPRFMKNILKVIDEFKTKPLLYILISTDSVYDVSRKPVGFDDANEAQKTWYSQETEAARPSTQDEIDKLKRFDQYGDEKFAVEELLVASNLPHLIFRLPDVIGPRDGTDRWLTYYIWDLIAKDIKHPIACPMPLFTKKLSFVYGPDVPRIVLQAIESFNSSDSHNFNGYNVFNFGWTGTLSLPHIIASIQQHTTKKGVVFEKVFKEVEMDKSGYPISYYPSVTRGPIDTTRVVSTFPEFKMTSVAEAVSTTNQFFAGVIRRAVEQQEKRDSEGYEYNEMYDAINSLWQDFGHLFTAGTLSTAVKDKLGFKRKVAKEDL